MFKLDQSLAQAKGLAAKEPDRFEVGASGWVTARFSGEDPLPKSIWSKWLKESHDLAQGFGSTRKSKKKKA